MEMVTTVIAGVLVLGGAFFALVAALGLWRFPDIYSRMHAASKAGTLGSGLVLLALAVHAGDTATVTRALAGIVFFLLTAPISAHLLAKSAYVVGYGLAKTSVLDEMRESKTLR
ncbi:monovalent cation/H(+) antiporter subunit G [Oricola cellulosilytica]|uniref:Monovalent cation/H(+) antiporter subunit G n=1 Tax=Oricola cellulosilytica TaxID=1429082 RepID=A0A4R0PC35_9HYPH|nr:monovalent cation/H(+) antiporter subunit G [Oricola cellulosilytica]TCD14093.1 monovalent cation/H(+) antiporter subunit G [Oricola cellulosilytica]